MRFEHFESLHMKVAMAVICPWCPLFAGVPSLVGHRARVGFNAWTYRRRAPGAQAGEARPSARGTIRHTLPKQLLAATEGVCALLKDALTQLES